MNGAITQLTRIQPGKDIEQAHMRNRALISNWVIEKGAANNVVAMQNGTIRATWSSTITKSCGSCLVNY